MEPKTKTKQRQLKVVGKGLKGKHELPVVTFSDGEGNKLTLYLETPKQLEDFQLFEIHTVTVTKEQQTLPT